MHAMQEDNKRRRVHRVQDKHFNQKLGGLINRNRPGEIGDSEKNRRDDSRALRAENKVKPKTREKKDNAARRQLKKNTL